MLLQLRHGSNFIYIKCVISWSLPSLFPPIISPSPPPSCSPTIIPQLPITPPPLPHTTSPLPPTLLPSLPPSQPSLPHILPPSYLHLSPPTPPVPLHTQYHPPISIALPTIVPSNPSLIYITFLAQPSYKSHVFLMRFVHNINIRDIEMLLQSNHASNYIYIKCVISRLHALVLSTFSFMLPLISH